MIVIIIEKHPDYRWLPGTEVECTPGLGQRLVNYGCAVDSEEYASYDVYLRYKEKQDKFNERQAKKIASKYRK